jgi:hypothetical protein
MRLVALHSLVSRDVAGDDGSDSDYEGNDLVSPEVESELPDVDPRDPTDSEGDGALDADDLPEQSCDELDVVDSRWCSPGPLIPPTPTASTRSIDGAQTPPGPPEHEPPTPEIDVSALRMVESTDEHQFTLEGPATRIGRKRRTIDLQTILEGYTCGQLVTDGEISRRENVIKCKSAGCETGWVSQTILGEQHRQLRWHPVPSPMCRS